MNAKYFSLLATLLFSSCLTESLEVIESGPSFTDEEYATLSQELNIPRVIDNFDITLAAHMSPSGREEQVDVDPARALLGRVLFYDNRLSSTGETNCSSCHKQELAFSDDVAFSKGINNQFTERNSIALAAVPNFQTSYDGVVASFSGETVQFFWDERAPSIQVQSRETIENTIEMGHNLNELAANLNEVATYRILGRYAFGTEQLDPVLITQALQDFCNSLVSANSRFDRLRDQELFGPQANNEPRWTTQEQRGLGLYRNNCGACHSMDMTNPGVNAASNGLDLNPEDLGKGEHFGRAFNGIFKVPFLRNIELTGPYMHDGRFDTLEEVLDHYSNSIAPHINLHPLLQDEAGNPRNLNFSDEDKAALIAFLQTTTDERLITEERFSNPFR
ncbi:MAG: cytochrome c peroxidase [Bacteroidota bacterium]